MLSSSPPSRAEEALSLAKRGGTMPRSHRGVATGGAGAAARGGCGRFGPGEFPPVSPGDRWSLSWEPRGFFSVGHPSSGSTADGSRWPHHQRSGLAGTSDPAPEADWRDTCRAILADDELAVRGLARSGARIDHGEFPGSPSLGSAEVTSGRQYPHRVRSHVVKAPPKVPVLPSHEAGKLAAEARLGRRQGLGEAESSSSWGAAASLTPRAGTARRLPPPPDLPVPQLPRSGLASGLFA